MKPSEICSEGRYGVIQGMDPAADWLLGPGIECYLPNDPENTLIPCIMRLQDDLGIRSLNELLKFGPEIYIAQSFAADWRAGRYYTALCRKSFFDRLASDPEGPYRTLSSADKVIKLCSPQYPSALPELVADRPYPEVNDPGIGPQAGGWPKDTVVVGIIDDGIAFAHERFRKGIHDTRVQCFWHQDGDWDANFPTVSFGDEICKGDRPDGRFGIDRLLRECTVGGSVDEDMVYRRAGLIDFSDANHKAAARRAAHGTHVLDLAAGADMKESVTNRPIIAVQLQSAVTADTSGAGLEDKLLEGIKYILERAAALSGTGGTLPVVINFSYGLIAGSKDGRSIVETAFDDFIGKGVRIVLPAGNSHLSRCYAGVRFKPRVARGRGSVWSTEEPPSLRWRVQPDDLTCSTLEIWLPQDGAQPPANDRVRLSIVTPSGEASPWLGETHNAIVGLQNDEGQIICLAHYYFVAESQRGLFRIDLSPTARLQPAATPALAPSGTWEVRFQNVSFDTSDLVQAWIQRDDTPYGYPLRGRQSYFDEPCYVRFDAQGLEIEDEDPNQPLCVVRRESLINAIATGSETIVAGGFSGREFRAVSYSAGGPIAHEKPDALLVSDDSKVHSGILAAGSHSGSVVAFSGTSVAAPQLTRWIATELAMGRPGDRNAVCEKAQADEVAWPPPPPPMPARPPPPPTLPPNRGGCGRITQISGLPVVKLRRCC